MSSTPSPATSIIPCLFSVQLTEPLSVRLQVGASKVVPRRTQRGCRHLLENVTFTFGVVQAGV